MKNCMINVSMNILTMRYLIQISGCTGGRCFAFENWHSALEMKRYIKRYIHHIGGLPDFTALRFTKYNQYESMILPMVKYLENAGVVFHYNTKVVNVEFDVTSDRKQATRIEVETEGETRFVDLTEDDSCIHYKWRMCGKFCNGITKYAGSI